jgi:hypothetical protein
MAAKKNFELSAFDIDILTPFYYAKLLTQFLIDISVQEKRPLSKPLPHAGRGNHNF